MSKTRKKRNRRIVSTEITASDFELWERGRHALECSRSDLMRWAVAFYLIHGPGWAVPVEKLIDLRIKFQAHPVAAPLFILPDDPPLEPYPPSVEDVEPKEE